MVEKVITLTNHFFVTSVETTEAIDDPHLEENRNTNRILSNGIGTQTEPCVDVASRYCTTAVYVPVVHLLATYRVGKDHNNT